MPDVVALKKQQMAKYAFILLSTLLFSQITYAAITVIDDTHSKVSLKSPANRIISLSPNLTEILFEIGAGEKIVARDRNSNYPQEVQKLPILANYYKLNKEKILAEKADLIVVEQSALLNKDLIELKRMGIPIYVSHTMQLHGVINTIRNFGKLSGYEEIAKAKADFFYQEVSTIKNKHSQSKRVTVFYELWNKPLLTVNNRTIIGEIIQYCGGVNLFGTLYSTTPCISRESIFKHNPDVIVGSDKHLVATWSKMKYVTAVKNGHVFVIDPNIIERTGPRLFQGMREICHILEKVRKEPTSIPE